MTCDHVEISNGQSNSHFLNSVRWTHKLVIYCAIQIGPFRKQYDVAGLFCGNLISPLTFWEARQSTLLKSNNKYPVKFKFWSSLTRHLIPSQSSLCICILIVLFCNANVIVMQKNCKQYICYSQNSSQVKTTFDCKNLSITVWLDVGGQNHF
jgi:hypothetical protein